MVKITFCDKRTGKDLWSQGEVKSFCDWTPDPVYVKEKSNISDAIRSAFDIDDDVDIYVEKADFYEEGNYYYVGYFSGSPHRGVNMSEHQKKQFEAGKCCGWNHDVLIELNTVIYEPVTDFEL